MIEVPCNFCNRTEYRVRFPAAPNTNHLPEVAAFRCTNAVFGNHAQIVECRNCGHVFANPRWSAAELLDTYGAVEDETYVAEQYGRERTFKHHLASLEKITGPGNGRPLLDVGAYTGVFVRVANAAGWQATGVEPSSWAVQEAQQSGLAVLEGTLDSAALDGRKYDVITLWDVIEHVADPGAELDRAYELLNPGGIIAVHTMDIESLTARLMGSRWPWLMDMHVHYFSQRTLNRFLKKSGFEIIWTGAQGRYLSLGYLVSRVTGLSRPLGRIFGGLVRLTGVQKATVPVNFGDLMTAYARKANSGRM